MCRYIFPIIITLILSSENFCQKINYTDSVITNSFNIDSDPSGAEVFVNDSLYGHTPIKIFNNKRTFSIRLIDSVKNQWTYDIDNTIGANKNIYALINKNYGLLGIFSSPSGAKIYINDSLVGSTPLRHLKFHLA